ncbi:MAG: WGR domain-containing protein, partial [Myxococcota bacterium]|nr:WGR domain-containing protein [Myxococcota bacterium]
AKAAKPAPEPAAAKPAAASSASGTPGARYFEFVEGSSSKFWEIAMDDTSVTTRYGKIGTAGQQTEKDFDSKADAFKEYDKLVTEKTKKGYVEKGAGGDAGGGAEHRNPDLEKAILADPYDLDAYKVYADWLQEQGDPRGELIALQVANKLGPATKLLEKHADYFLGPLAAHTKQYDHGEKDAFTWKFGYIHAAALSHNQYADSDFDGTIAEILDQLLRHPSGRFLTELTLTFNDDPNESTLDDVFAILAKKAPPTLRKLHVGDFEYPDDTEMSWYHVGNMGKLWKALPNLEHLIVQGGEFALGTLELGKLKHAEFRTGGLSKASAKAIASAACPNLEHLEIWYGTDEYGGDASVKDVLPLLARTDLPKLTTLGLKNAQFTNELCGALPKAKLLRQLKKLDLSMGILTDEGAGVLAEHKDAFTHLEVLDVSDTYVTKAGVASLKGMAKSVVAKELRADEDPEYRYVSVGE